MSLKQFHLVFIALSIALAVVCAWWGFANNVGGGFGIGASVVAAALIVLRHLVRQKIASHHHMKTSSLLRGLLPAAVLLLISGESSPACSICMGAPDSPTGGAMNNAIFFMLGILGAMFLGIGAVVLGMYRRRHNPISPAQVYADPAH